MISIPITEEAYEALKAKIPRIDQAPTSKGRNGRCGFGSIASLSTVFSRAEGWAKVIAT